METCLWAQSAIARHLNPAKVRCVPTGIMFCKPCLDKYHPKAKK